MTWVYDPPTQAYRLIAGRYRCAVRRMPAGQWVAVVSHHGQGADAYSFDTQAEAQTWCEARLAEMTPTHSPKGQVNDDPVA